MIEIEDQLRRFGEAIERDLLLGNDVPAVAPVTRTRSSGRVFAMVAVVLIIALVVVVNVARRPAKQDSVMSGAPRTGMSHARGGVFSTSTGTVLLFSDGVDGAFAVDLDRRLAGRRAIDGERVGDQSFRLTLTGDHLVVGWDEIYAAPLGGGPSRKVADATIYIPASEPGEVWTLAWEGRRTGVGASVLRQVRVDGTVVFSTSNFDSKIMQPVLGPGPATSTTSDGRSIAWCLSSCSSFHVVKLGRTGSPPAPSIAPGSQQIAMSPDGSRIALLRPTGDHANLVLIDRSTSDEVVMARGLDASGALEWTRDSGQLFYTKQSFRQSSMRVGRLEVGSRRWEIHSLPVGAGLAPALPLDRTEARSFLSADPVAAADCPRSGVSYPTERKGACTFAFFTPDSADECVAAGPRVVGVPDGIGIPLIEAGIRMQRAGLNVVGSGVSPGDPGGRGAVVTAQEPPFGTMVPEGACVGFRTSG